jgi:hypothetical protein
MSLYRDEDPTTSRSTSSIAADLQDQDRDWLTRRGDLPIRTEPTQAYKFLPQCVELPADSLVNPTTTSIIQRRPPAPRIALKGPSPSNKAGQKQQSSMEDATNLNSQKHLPVRAPTQAASAGTLSSFHNLNHGLGISPPLPDIAELPGSSVASTSNSRLPVLTIHAHDNQPQDHTPGAEMDEDERALAEAIERSLRNQNRYTRGGTDLEELQEAIVTSIYQQ